MKLVCVKDFTGRYFDVKLLLKSGKLYDGILFKPFPDSLSKPFPSSEEIEWYKVLCEDKCERTIQKEYFITLHEWRENQINEILNEL